LTALSFKGLNNVTNSEAVLVLFWWKTHCIC